MIIVGMVYRPSSMRSEFHIGGMQYSKWGIVTAIHYHNHLFTQYRDAAASYAIEMIFSFYEASLMTSTFASRVMMALMIRRRAD